MIIFGIWGLKGLELCSSLCSFPSNWEQTLLVLHGRCSLSWWSVEQNCALRFQTYINLSIYIIYLHRRLNYHHIGIGLDFIVVNWFWFKLIGFMKNSRRRRFYSKGRSPWRFLRFAATLLVPWMKKTVRINCFVALDGGCFSSFEENQWILRMKCSPNFAKRKTYPKTDENTVDGSEIWLTSWYDKYPMIYKASYMLGHPLSHSTLKVENLMTKQLSVPWGTSSPLGHLRCLVAKLWKGGSQRPQRQLKMDVHTHTHVFATLFETSFRPSIFDWSPSTLKFSKRS